MAKKRKPSRPLSLPSVKSRTSLSPEETRKGVFRILLLLALLALTAFLYYFLSALYAYAFLFFYGVAALLGFGYVLANRCFSRHGVTMADLPPTMSQAEKETYLSERERRKRQTAWMLYGLIPLLLEIGFDVLYVLQGERIAAFFKKLK